jgi:hypothetical protein
MKQSDVRNLRLFNQQISATKCKSPEDVVKWLVAMQAQEFRHAKWAIGLRLQNATDHLVEKAFNAGAILRTHLMRPTWHFVSPEDIRWLLALTAPRVHAGNQPYYKKFELTSALLRRSNDIISRSLEGGKFLIRNDLQEILKQNKIIAEGPKLAYIMMYAELEGLICSGPRIGKQFSYALLDERVPQEKVIERDEALSLFLLRYFNSRGPATLQDFTYWSGLTLKDARTGIESVRNHLHKVVLDGKEYFSGNLTLPENTKGQDTFLMPDYDEYGMSYKDRSALAPDVKKKQTKIQSPSVFNHYVVVEGAIQGTWRDEIIKDSIKVLSVIANPMSPGMKRKIDQALIRYSTFLGKNLQSAAKITVA